MELREAPNRPDTQCPSDRVREEGHTLLDTPGWSLHRALMLPPVLGPLR